MQLRHFVQLLRYLALAFVVDVSNRHGGTNWIEREIGSALTDSDPDLAQSFVDCRCRLQFADQTRRCAPESARHAQIKA